VDSITAFPSDGKSLPERVVEKKISADERRHDKQEEGKWKAGEFHRGITHIKLWHLFPQISAKIAHDCARSKRVRASQLWTVAEIVRFGTGCFFL